MAKLVFGMMQSLDGYVTGDLPMPNDELHQHFNDHVRALSGAIYGRTIYEIMRYWEEVQPDFNAVAKDFADAWQNTPKYVFSSTLSEVGPNAQLVKEDLGAFVTRLKDETDGVLEVAGPQIASALTELGLIDEYRLYYVPVVSGSGKPFFMSSPPPMRIVSHEMIGGQALCVTCVPV